jgi:hypothetical protein
MTFYTGTYGRYKGILIRYSITIYFVVFCLRRIRRKQNKKNPLLRSSTRQKEAKDVLLNFPCPQGFAQKFCAPLECIRGFFVQKQYTHFQNAHTPQFHDILSGVLILLCLSSTAPLSYARFAGQSLQSRAAEQKQGGVKACAFTPSMHSTLTYSSISALCTAGID